MFATRQRHTENHAETYTPAAAPDLASTLSTFYHRVLKICLTAYSKSCLTAGVNPTLC